MTETRNDMMTQITERLKEVYDPELPVNVYDLGLIYHVQWEEATKQVDILMTLTTPSCPAAELLPANIRKAVQTLPNVASVNIRLTFEPPYTIERLSEDARLILGYPLKETAP